MSGLVSQLCFCAHNSVSLLDNLYYWLFVTYFSSFTQHATLTLCSKPWHWTYSIFSIPQLGFYLLFDIPNVNEYIFFYFHYLICLLAYKFKHTFTMSIFTYFYQLCHVKNTNVMQPLVHNYSKGCNKSFLCTFFFTGSSLCLYQHEM